MTNEQLIARIRDMHTHQLHIESLERLLQNAIDRSFTATKSAHHIRIERALNAEREIQHHDLIDFRIDMKA